MRRIVVLLTVLSLVFAFSALGIAGPKALDDTGYTNPNPDVNTLRNSPTWIWTGPSEPENADNPWQWNPPYGNPGLPGNGYTLAAGASVALYRENRFLSDFKKTITLIAEYAGGDLDFVEAGWGYQLDKDPGTNEQVKRSSSTDQFFVRIDDGATLKVEFDIIPQPDYEWILIKNNGGSAATLTADMLFERECALPSLTQWGMIALVVLMLAAGAMVIVRRRRAVARA